MPLENSTNNCISRHKTKIKKELLQEDCHKPRRLTRVLNPKSTRGPQKEVRVGRLAETVETRYSMENEKEPNVETKPPRVGGHRNLFSSNLLPENF